MVSREVEIECLPADIPDEVRVDISGLMMGKQVRAVDLPLDTTKVRRAGSSAGGTSSLAASEACACPSRARPSDEPLGQSEDCCCSAASSAFTSSAIACFTSGVSVTEPEWAACPAPSL